MLTGFRATGLFRSNGSPVSLVPKHRQSWDKKNRVGRPARHKTQLERFTRQIGFFECHYPNLSYLGQLYAANLGERRITQPSAKLILRLI